MHLTLENQSAAAPPMAWAALVLGGLAAPALGLLLFSGGAAGMPAAGWSAPLLAVGMMACAMIGGALAASFARGIALGMLAGSGLLIAATALGMASPAQLAAIGLAFAAASISFAARGALFARSAGMWGPWVALFVVSGEVAILATALALPEALPAWLLALLPAQWASTAIDTALAQGGALAALAPLIALVGTAGATLLVRVLLPRRWPYAIMFTTWLACSALVWHWPAGHVG